MNKNNKDNKIKYVIKIYFDLILNHDHVSPNAKSRFSTIPETCRQH